MTPFVWIIRPKPELYLHLSALQEERAGLLLEPTGLWGGRSFGDSICDADGVIRLTSAETRARQVDARIEFVKLVYLAQIREYFDDEIARFVFVFGSERISAALFDRWWELETTPRECENLDSCRGLLVRFHHLIDITANETLARILSSLKA